MNFDIPNPESEKSNEGYEIFKKLFDEVEEIFIKEGRESAKGPLVGIYTSFKMLNGGIDPFSIWNSKGSLTEPQFNELNLRRKVLDNEIGIMTSSGTVRHNLHNLEPHQTLKRPEPSLETEQEARLFSLGEINSKLALFLKQEKPEILETFEDEKGIYLHEIAVVGIAGERAVFSYRRFGNFPKSKASNTLIDVVYYRNGVVIGGHTLTNYNEETGVWMDEN